MKIDKLLFSTNRLVLLVMVGLATLLGYWWGVSHQGGAKADLKVKYEQAKAEHASSTLALNNQIKELESKLSKIEEEKEDVASDLRSAERKLKKFDDQIQDVASVMETIGKLSKVDNAMLQKYSKIYFLNEHYVPASLTLIDSKYTEGKQLSIHSNVHPFLDNLLQDAEGAGINLRIVSAYRSFGEQSSLKSSYRVTYGAGTANQFSADQGYSEHQLGTAVDFAVMGEPAFEAFEKTEAYKWLEENAERYGFTLSYPPDNIYYQYEPWHWRFVGVELAEYLADEDKYFYDLDQREINSYIVKLFD